MNDLETKIKITVENGTAAGFNQAASAASNASKQIENAIGQVRSELTRSFSEMQKSMEKAFDIDMSDFVGGVSDGKEKVSELNAELAKTGDKAEEAAGGLGKIGTVLAGFATLSFAKSLLDTADAMQSINSQVRQVTSSETEYLSVRLERLRLHAAGNLAVYRSHKQRYDYWRCSGRAASRRTFAVIASVRQRCVARR